MTSSPPDSSWDRQFRPQTPAAVPPQDPGPDPTPAWLILLLSGAVILAGIGFVFLDSDDGGRTPVTEVAGAVEESTSSTAPTTTATTTPSTTSSAPTTATTTSAVATTTTTTTTSTTTTTPPANDSITIRLPARQTLIDGVANPDTRTAVFSGGKVYLRGEVPSQDIADLIASRAVAVLGQENVVVEYVLNPEAPVPNSAPLYVDDKVLFAVSSAEINPGFAPLLDLGTSLMQQIDTVRISVIAHTDSVGSEEANQLLSERRAQGVKAYWLDAGIDASRIDAIGLGESVPQADNLLGEGRAANRRAEFIVHGILG
ncbi:MAG: OmpA family protein [Acidimicrobiales bacterium]|nr:OmpA family protein [Acidimicrobiales bacterium]